MRNKGDSPLAQPILDKASVEIYQDATGIALGNDDDRQILLPTKKPLSIIPNEPGVGVSLDASSWPIVHGSAQSADNTPERQPKNINLSLYSSQDKINDESVDSMYLGQLMMSYMVADQDHKGGLQEFAHQAANLVNFNLGDANPVSIMSQKISDTQQILWTSTIGEVIAYRETSGKPTLERLASLTRAYNFRFHGSYAFVATHNGSTGFFTTADDSVVRYELQGSDMRGWQVVETSRVSIPQDVFINNDHLVGVTVLEDGTIAACSKQGIIMAIRMGDDNKFLLMSSLQLSKYATAKPSHVSNSISSDGYGIYIATQREMVRVDYDPYAQKLGFKWSNVYGPPQPWYVGRLGPGSGSTPTITSCGGQRLVVITDGALPMNLLYYDVQTGQNVASKKVQFGVDEDGYLPTTSEQSVAVDGCRAFVVQNFVGTSNLSPDIRCTGVPGVGQLRQSLADFCNSMNFNNGTDLFTAKACPSVFGCSAYGAATFEVQPSTKKPDGTMAVKRLWTRPDISCGTAIPLISTHKDSHAAYCLGLRDDSSLWTLIGMDMDTGKDVLSHRLYNRNGPNNFFANPFYAGVEAMGEDKVAVGSVGGVLYLAKDSTSPVSMLSSIFSRVGREEGAQPEVYGPIVGIILVVVAAVIYTMRGRIRPASSPRLP